MKKSVNRRASKSNFLLKIQKTELFKNNKKVAILLRKPVIMEQQTPLVQLDYFSLLSLEIIYMILQWLDIDTLIYLQQINKEFYNIINTKYLWENITIQDHPFHLNARMVINYVNSIKPSLKKTIQLAYCAN